MAGTPELDKMSEFINSGAREHLSHFWDWLESQGYWLAREEAAFEDRPCPNPACDNGTIIVANRDPYAGWSTSIPETVEEDCPRCDGKTYVRKYFEKEIVSYTGGPERLFAKYMGIDLAKVDLERRALLDEIRRQRGD